MVLAERAYCLDQLRCQTLCHRQMGGVSENVAFCRAGRSCITRFKESIGTSDDEGARMSPQDDTSVVVCTRNSSATLRQCLNTIQRNEPLEIIVIDGQSSDNTLEIASEFTGSILSDNGLGLGFARQLGVSSSKGSYVAFVDSDIILPDRFLSRMVSELRESGYAGIHAQIRPGKCGTYWEWAESLDYELEYNKPGPKAYINTQAALFEREALEGFGFDEFFEGAGEDRDLCLRMANAGLVVGVGSSAAYHMHRSTLRDRLHQTIWYGKGMARLGWKHRRISFFCEPLYGMAYGLLLWFAHRQGKMLPYWLMTSLGSSIGIISELWRMRRVPRLPPTS